MEHVTQMTSSAIEAVILDWAGTTVDFGSLAPIHGFIELFKRRGITLDQAQARGPMGAEKREHIHQLCQLPSVQQQWRAQYDCLPGAADVDQLYAEFIPIQRLAIAERAGLIPGMIPFVQWAREREVKLGANTGYAREMIPQLLACAAAAGYTPQSVVCATEVAKGRPYPNMSLINAMELGVRRLASCVKVDDTQPGIDEGLNAGMWTVAVAISGNQVGMSQRQWESLEASQQQVLRGRAHCYFAGGGAHYVIDSVAQIVPVLHDIEQRILGGEKP